MKVIPHSHHTSSLLLSNELRSMHWPDNIYDTSDLRWIRQLSAPSVRFWQQTAICPVSLWALVIELHPLNWALAQAVRWISDKVTMEELEEQRVCVCVCVCMWNFATNLVKILQRHFNSLTKHTGRTVYHQLFGNVIKALNSLRHRFNHT